MITSIIFFVLFALAIAWAQHERVQKRLDNRLWRSMLEANDKAWEKGLDEQLENHEQDYLTLHELYESCHMALEATTEELGEVARQSDVNWAHFTDMKREYNNTRLMLENARRAHSNTINEKDALEALFVQLSEKYDELDELYAEASTELLETVIEIDSISKEVHDWMRPGTPFD